MSVLKHRIRLFSRIANVFSGGNSRRTIARAILAAGVFSMLVGTVLTALPTPSANAAAGINKQINFQGKVANSNGTNVANGSYSFVFKLYSVASAGSAIWTETKTLTVTDGIFQTNLGSVTSLPGSVDFNTDNIYLGINFNSDGEMTPRIQFTAAAYAFNSDKLQGLGAADFAQINPSSAQSGSLNVTGTVQAATSLQAPLVDTATAAALGIGTATASSVTVGRATSTTAVTIQGSNSSTWAVTGASGTTTLAFAAPSGSNTVTFPAATGTVCLQTLAACGFAPGTSSSYIQNQLAAAQSANMYVTSGGADTDATVTLKTTSTQTGALIEAKDSSAVTTFLLTAGGSVKTIGSIGVGTIGSLPVSGSLYVTTGTASNVLATLRGKAGQTGDLLDLQNQASSIGWNVAKFDASGLLTLGNVTSTAGRTQAGSATFADGTTDNFGATLNTSTLTANRTISLPDAGGTLCTTVSSTCSATYQVASATGYLTKNAADTSSAAVTASNYLYGFTNSSSAVASGVLKLDNGSNTGSGLTVVGSGNPASGQALILANGATGITGKLLDLQVNAASKFNVDQAGAVTTGSTINGQTISSTASFTGTVAAATSFLGPLFATTDVASGTSSNVTVRSGNGTAGGASSGNVTVDAGSKNGAGFAGNVYIGNTNALNVNIGHNAATASGTAVSIQGLAATSSIIMNDATNTNQTTIGFRAPTATNNIYFPNAGGDICTTVAATCNTTYQPYSAAGYLAKSPTSNEASTSNFAAYQYSFTNSNTGAAGVLALSGAGTNSPLSVTTSGNAGANQAVILATNTNGTPTGSLIDLRVTAGSKFSVDTAGAVLTSSTINGQTISSAASFTGTVTAATGITATSGGLTVTGTGTFNNALNVTGLTTTTGGITNNSAGIAAAGAISGATTITVNGTITGGGTFKTADTAAASTASGAVSLTSGNASGTGGTSSSGAVSIDSGTSTNGTTGAITVGSTNASAVTIGRAGAPTTIQGNGSLLIQANNGANYSSIAFASPTAQVAYTLGTNGSNTTANICTSLSASCNTTYQPYLASGYLVKSPTSNEASSSNFTGYQYTFTQSSGTSAGNLSLVNSGTSSALLVTAASNPSSGQAAITVNNSNGTPSGNLFDLQKGGTSQFAVDFAGNVITLAGASSGKFNGQTISSTANFTGTVTSASALTVTAGGITVGGNSSITGTLGVSNTLTVSAGGASITGGINNNAGGITGAGAVSGLSSLQYNTNGTLDTSAANSITIGGVNASSLLIGRTGVTTTMYGTTQIGASPGTGSLTNNGSTTNTEKTIADRNGGSGLSIGSAATTVDIYTYISVTQTTASQTITIPSPTANTVYGKLLYLSNVGTASFVLLGATINPGATATLIWANTNGAASWQFAGADAGSLQTAYNNSATTDPQFQLSNTNGGLKIRDAASSTIGNLLQITDSTGTAPAYLAVTAAASTITGNLLFTKENSRTIQVNDTTTAATAGAALTVKAAAGNTSGVGGNLVLAGGAGGNAAAGGSASLFGGAAGGGNSAGGPVTVGGGSATGTGTGGTVTIQGGAASATAGSAGGSLSVIAANGSSTGAGGNGGSISITAGNGLGSAGNGGSITLTSGSSTSGTAGGINLTSPVTTVGTAGASIFKNNGATYTNACAYTGVTGAVTLNTASKTPDVCTTFMLTTSGAATITVPAPAAGAGSIVYVSVSSASTNAISLLSANIGIGSTATLVYNGTVWTFAGADASGLQTAYNNTLTSPASIVTTSATKNILFQAGTTFDNNALLQVSNSVGANMLSVDTTNTATSLNLMPNSGAETTSGFSTTYPTTGFGTVGSTELQTTTAGTFAAGAAAVTVTATAATSGIRANLGAALATSTIHNISFSVKSGSAWTNDIDVRYNRTGTTSDGATAVCSTASPSAGSTFSTRTISTTAFTKVSCYFTTSSTAGDATANIVIFQTASATRTFYIDNIAVIAQNTTGTQDVGDLMVGGANGQGLTLLTLDSYANTPWTGTANTSLLGSMYYDTSVGLIKCYQASGWGTCGAAPNNNVFMIPEYGNAVLNGSGSNNTGTMTANLCSGTSRLSINTSTCGATDDYNYYQWTSSQATAQTYDIYVRYQLPPTFNTFLDNNTIKAVARTSSTTDGIVNFSLYQANGTQCGSTTDLTTSGGANTWTQSSLTGNELSCSFTAGDIMTFKVNMSSKNNALVYASNISFTMTGK